MGDISFFPPELLLHNYMCGGYVPCCATVNIHTRLKTETEKIPRNVIDDFGT